MRRLAGQCNYLDENVAMMRVGAEWRQQEGRQELRRNRQSVPLRTL